MTGQVMRRLLCVAFCFGVFPGSVGAAELVVGEGFETIQGAIDAAGTGDTVVVKAGEYEGPLVFKSGVRLKGEGWDKVRIISHVSVSQEPVISFSSCNDAVLEGLSIEQTGSGEADKGAVYIMGGNVEMIDCAISSTAADGVSVGPVRAVVVMKGCSIVSCGQDGIDAEPGKGEVTITDCSVTDNGRAGIRISRWCRGAIRSCTVMDNGTGISLGVECDVVVADCVIEANGTQIHVQGGSKAKILDNTITDGKGEGIYVTSKNTEAVIRGNKITNNRGYGAICRGDKAVLTENVIEGNRNYGISFLNETKGEITDNKVSGNGKGGAVVYQSAKVQVRGNTFEGNRGHGLFISGESEGVASDNTCTKNTSNGIHISSQAAGWDVSENRCFENSCDGICVRGETVCPVLTDNTCKDNSAHGICLCLSSAATLKGNQCSGNKGYGLSVSLLASTVLESNVFEGNGVKDVYIADDKIGRVRDLLLASKFGDIEKVASRLRETKEKTSEGRSWLSRFYLRIGNGWGTPGHERFDWFCGVVEEWLEEYPESVTAHNLKINNLDRAAAKARGTKAWEDTPQENRKAYKAGLEKAWAVIEKGMELPEKDGEFYAYALSIASRLEKEKEVLEDLFVKGVAVAPYYHKMYSFRCRYLMEQGLSKPGELETFMDKSYELTKEAEGAGIYGRLATYLASLYGVGELKDNNISYTKFEAGFRDLLKLYPDSQRFQNGCCVVAVAYKDRETAKKMFEKIGSAWMPEIWKSKAAFNTAKAWAYSLKDV